jgi:hypothetical protein
MVLSQSTAAVRGDPVDRPACFIGSIYWLTLSASEGYLLNELAGTAASEQTLHTHQTSS